MKCTYVIHNDHPSSDKKRSLLPSEKLNWWWAIPLITIIALVIGLSLLAFYQLPCPILDDTPSNAEYFLASRAKSDLQELVDIGPKVVGSTANEQLAVKFLIDKISDIIVESSDLYTIEYDIQQASGGNLLRQSTNLYESIQNVVVKMTPNSAVSDSSLLVNTHFDTVPESPGAGDAGTMVVVMLGVMRTLARSKEAVQHPVVFLFNGAEENGLQGSHAFITQHSWAQNITAFVNLDAAGIGGKEILFQTGPDNPWLVDYYHASVKHPYASTISEEVFENHLVPSDSDFRIFRDYGKIPGLDLAHANNDYVYHTRYDRIELIPEGTYQHTGDNILALVRALANAPELDYTNHQRAHGNAVYFDVFGLFMISYTETTGIIVNSVICIVALITIIVSTWLVKRAAAITTADMFSKFGIIFLIQLVSLVIGGGVLVLVAFVIDTINYPMAWFSQPWLLFGFYFCPFIFIMGLMPALYLGWKKFNTLPIRFGITLFLHSNCLILIVLIIALTALSIRSIFLITIGVIFYTTAILFNLITRVYLRPFIWIIPILIGQAIPIAFVSYVSEITYFIFIPITGRSGTTANPELIIALSSIVFAYLMFGFIIPIFSIFHKAKIILTSFLVVMLVFIILMFTSVGFPYTAETAPQRHSIFHTKRIMHDITGAVTKEDSGYYLIAWDRLSPSTLSGIATENGLILRDAKMDCETELFCGLPHYSSGMRNFINSAYWIESNPPEFRTLPTLLLQSRDQIDQQSYRYTFVITGTKQTEIFIKPSTQSYLSGWSFPTSEVPQFKQSTNEEYFVHLRFGLSALPYTFSLDISMQPGFSRTTLRIALVGHYQKQHTEEFQNFLNLFPVWTSVSAFESSYESWEF